MNIRTLARRTARLFDAHQPLVQILLSRDNLLHNFKSYQTKYPGLKFAPVLKSNAYGHGLVPIAQILDTQDIAFFMVDSYFEARILRHGGIRSRIAIIGYVRPEEIINSVLKDVDYAVVDLEQLREVCERARTSLRIHLKIDTGMHRHGILPNQLDETISLLQSNSRLQVVGVCSHFADADNSDQTHTQAQIAVWNEAVEKLRTEFPTIQYRHIAATKGVAMSEQAHANVARLGIGLYGFDTSPASDLSLKPVLELRSIISSLREVPAGEFVGYNATYTTTKPARIATVPAGYFEGIDRRLSNRGSVLIHGKSCRLIGRISMNMCSIDVTNVPEAKAGDEVVLISRNPGDPNSITEMAKLVSMPEYKETIYVLLAHLPQHLKRVVV